MARIEIEQDIPILIQEGIETIFIRMADGTEYCLDCLIHEHEEAINKLKDLGQEWWD